MTERITITLQDRHTAKATTIEARSGSNLWHLLRKHGIPIGSSCSGVGVCSSCAIEVHAAETDAISSETPFETQSKERNQVDPTKRISCLVRVWKNITVVCN